MGFWKRLFGGREAPVVEVSPPPVEVVPPPVEVLPPPVEVAPPPPVAMTSRYPEILGKTHEMDFGLHSATPIADVWIQGIPCKAGRMVSFRRDGGIQTAWLAREHTVGGEVLPAGSLIGFSSDGQLLFTRVLLEPRTWQVPTKPERAAPRPLTVPAGSEVDVEGGQLRRATLAAAIDFDGMAFPAQTQLTFGDSGALSHVDAPDEIALRGIRWAECETVVFEFGCLHEGRPAADGHLDGIPYRGHEIVRLHGNGVLARCTLAAEATISGVPCAEDTRIYLDDEGRFLEGTVARDYVLAGVPVAAGSEVSLDEGVPVALTPRKNVEVDGVPCVAGELVELTTEGRLVRGTLARAHAFGAWTLSAGSTFVLDGDRLEKLIATDATTPDGRVLAGTWRVHLAPRVQMWPTEGKRLGGEVVHLREACEVAGLTAHAGTAIELADDGSVRSLVLASEQRIGALTGKAKSRVRVHPNGAPSNLFLAEPATIGGVPCAAAGEVHAVMNGIETSYRCELRLRSDGAVGFATLAADATIQGVPLRGGETVGCHPGGKLQFGTLAARWTHPDGWVAERGTLLHLFEDGTPSYLTLAEAHGEHAAGSLLHFAAPGELKKASASRVPLVVEPCEGTA